MKKSINLSLYKSTYDRGVSLITESIWQVFKFLFFSNSIPLPSIFRVSLLRVFGASIGSNVVIRAKFNINMPWNLKIGNNVWIGEDVTFLALDLIVVGDNSCISQRAFLCTGSHDFRQETFNLITSPIIIGRSCWIGANAFIGPGIVLDDDTFIKACSPLFKTTNMSKMKYF